MREIKETDWKVLRRLHPLAVERFSERVLTEVEHVIDSNTESAHQRYLDIFRIIKRATERWRASSTVRDGRKD